MKIKFPLYAQILIALGAGVLAGSITGAPEAGPGAAAFRLYEFLGTLFLNALKLLIVPLIVSSMIHGIGNLGSGRDLGRMGFKTVLFYASSTLVAILAGLLLVNLLSPGMIDGEPVRDRIGLTTDSGRVEAGMAGKEAMRIEDFFLRMVPSNIVKAAAEGKMLGLIIFSLIFGFFMTRVPGRPGEIMKDFWKGIFETMMLVTEWIMLFAPFGIFGLVARVAATTGLEAIQPLAWFMVTVIGALGFHFLISLPLLLMLIGRISPRSHYRGMAPALLSAFSTASSSATVPITLDCLEKKAGVSNKTASFVIPLGATINMDGTALYECVAVLFIAQAYGLDLSLGAQAGVVILALLTSIGVAGIPAASLVAIIIILEAVGLPAEGI
ncbi:MAG TPA: dicarboxylate/amino acid:cation symporter, partial [Nitrospiria bacterium]|nr:dicarboxylate/amino acid:cation symporter [Nitrospiria bacterium]